MIVVVSISLAASAYAIQERSAVPPSGQKRVEPVDLAGVADTGPPATGVIPSPQETPARPDFSAYLPLLEELGRLQMKMEQEIQFPALRSQSKLMPLLPASTSIYLAAPNYGDSLHQAVQIFHRELLENEVLRNGWQSFPSGPVVEDALEKVYRFSQYLGNEVVVSADIKPRGGSALIIAEIRKPGLQAFLQEQIKQFSGSSGAPVRILNPQQLLTAKATLGTQAFVLVRSDLMVVAFELTDLKSFNAHLNQPGNKLPPTPFGQRLAQSYQAGAGILFGADLQRIKDLNPFGSAKEEAVFQKTGFANVKYLIVDRKSPGGQASDNSELTFNGPRHGIPSWLAAPRPMGSLDFISTDAGVVSTLLIKSPVQILNDIKDIAEFIQPGAGAALTQQAEAQLKINLEQDLLSKLGEEIALAIDGTPSPAPAWKAVLQVKDPDGLQKTLKQMLSAAAGFMKGEQPLALGQHIHDGQTYYSLQIPNTPKPVEVDYTFVDGYMIVAGNQTLLSDAILIHHSGKSLAKSSKLQDLLAARQSKDFSALLYQNYAHLANPMMQQAGLAHLFTGASGQSQPVATFAYGEENAIRVAGNNRSADVATVLVIAAIAIPNLMKSKMAANEYGGAATVRTLITDQITYSISYPEKGYAPDLASLGPGPDAECHPSKSHACLADAALGCTSGTSGEWCTKGVYRYTTTATCKQGVCDEFVVVGTPVDPSTGRRNFCATSDGVPRGQSGPPLTSPITVSECLSWNPL